MRFFDDEFGDPSYRSAVGMMILNAENKIFVGQRLDNKIPAWQMPQGGIDPHEDTDQIHNCPKCNNPSPRASFSAVVRTQEVFVSL